MTRGRVKKGGIRTSKEKETPAWESKINKYGFLHIPKTLAKHLQLELGKDGVDYSVIIEPTEEGFLVKISQD